MLYTKIKKGKVRSSLNIEYQSN